MTKLVNVILEKGKPKCMRNTFVFLRANIEDDHTDLVSGMVDIRMSFDSDLWGRALKSTMI